MTFRYKNVKEVVAYTRARDECDDDDDSVRDECGGGVYVSSGLPAHLFTFIFNATSKFEPQPHTEVPAA